MKYYCVISHTHWDREWYLPFEQFRMRLVDLIDNLLKILSEQPNFIFHLDAQSVILEDYLAVRKKNADLLKRYIQSKNIIVGPWYLQNDFILTSGESTIRNLLKGQQVLKEYGPSSMVGYAPDQFGNVSQLPQILHNFNITSFVFGRGYTFFKQEGNSYRKEEKKTEFYWVGADQSRLLAIFLHDWYNNAQRFSEDLSKAKTLLAINDDHLRKINTTPYLLLMNGVDHLQAQENLLPILQQLQEQNPAINIRQYTLDEYVACVLKNIDENHLSLDTFAAPLDQGDDYSMLRGCWSSRIYLKQQNVHAQDRLEVQIEPLYTMLEMMDFPLYDADYVDYFWTNLLKLQPHDNICGCSVDAVHAHMEDQFKKLEEATLMFLRKGLSFVSTHCIFQADPHDDYVLTLCNPSSVRVNQIIEADFDFLQEEHVKNFEIYDENQQAVSFEIVKKEKNIYDVYSPLNLPGSFVTDRYHVLLHIPSIQSFSFKKLLIHPVKATKVATKRALKNCMENSFYRIDWENENVNVFYKSKDKYYSSFVQFAYLSDCGDTYVCEPYGNEKKFRLCQVKTISNHFLQQKVQFTYELSCPLSFDYRTLNPDKKTRKQKITLQITLNKDDPNIYLSYSFCNHIRDQRIRILLNHQINQEIFYCDSAFDFLKRSPRDLCVLAKTKTHYLSTSAMIQDESAQCNLFTYGQHEIENLPGCFALTILRCNNYISRIEGHKPSAGKLWAVEEAECLRKIEGKLAVNFQSLSLGQIYTKARNFRNPLLTYFNSVDSKKFTGGRYAVQDSQIKELFYLDDPYETKQISLSSILQIQNENIVLSALKKGINGGYILRVFNPSFTDETTTITGNFHFYTSSMNEIKGDDLGNKHITLSIPSKKIITLLLEKNNDA